MPKNKNALFRIKTLDELLSSRGRLYTWEELAEEVNKKLMESGAEDSEGGHKQVSRRCVEKDVRFIEEIMGGEIKRERVVEGNASGRQISKVCIHYEDPNFSVFRKKLSKEESRLLKEVLRTLGQFDGLPDFSVIANLVDDNMAKDIDGTGERRIIAFDKNPTREYSTCKDVFARLFLAISRKQVIKLKYHSFTDIDDKKEVILHPCLLKEYNRRWFAFGITEGEESTLKPFPLDRIDDITPLPANKYSEYDGEIEEWFDDIIGVTKIEGEPVEKIVFWISGEEMHYITTKPLHESQKQIRRDEELRNKYAQLQGGAFFSIECRKNYELIRELCSFGGDLIVLEPSGIREAVVEKIKGMADAYMGVAGGARQD